MANGHHGPVGAHALLHVVMEKPQDKDYAIIDLPDKLHVMETASRQKLVWLITVHVSS